MKRRHRFPASTAGRRLPGVGLAITRANLLYAIRTKLIDPYTHSPKEIAEKMLGHPDRVRVRHVTRAWALTCLRPLKGYDDVPPQLRPVEARQPAAAGR